MEAERDSVTLGIVDSEHSQVEPEIQRNTVADVRADGIVDILADTLAK